MRIANPNSSLPFETVTKGMQGQDEYGFRIVDGIEEVIHIPSGKSNMNYYIPEVVTRYGDCTHVFKVVNMGLREVECQNCNLLTSFHPAVNYREENGNAYIILNHKEYELKI